jgi:arginine decarboxylase
MPLMRPVQKMRLYKNYTMDEYCSDILGVITSILDESQIKHPVIISESGRATVAYYSVLIFNILDINKLFYETGTPKLPAETHEYLHNLLDVHDSLSIKNFQESYNDALFYRDEILTMFLHGRVSLRERGIAEQIFWNILRRIVREAWKKSIYRKNCRTWTKSLLIFITEISASFNLYPIHGQ